MLDRLRRPLTALVALVALLTGACEEPPSSGPHPLTVRVRGPFSDSARVAIVDPSGPRVVTNARSTSLDVGAAEPGHEVWVGAPGCDLVRRRIGDLRTIELELRPSAHSSRLTLEGPRAELPMPRVRAQVLQSLAPSWGASRAERPFSFSSTRDLGPTTELATPSGYLNRIILESDDVVLVPSQVDLEPKREIRVQALAPHKARISAPRDLPEADAEVILVSVVHGTTPDVSADLQDAATWWMSRPNWCSVESDGRGGLLLGGLLDFDYHVFLSVGEHALHVFLPAGVREMSLPRPLARRLRRWPQVDGTDPAAGSKLFPGRLDLRVVAELLARDPSGRFGRTIAESPPSIDEAVAASSTDSFTVLGPQRTIAYGTWGRDGTANATTEPGSIRIEPSDFAGERTVILFPAWADGRLDSSSSIELFRHAWSARDALELSGLPLGDYRLRLVAGTAGPAELLGSANRTRVVRLRPDSPKHRVRLESR